MAAGDGTDHLRPHGDNSRFLCLIAICLVAGSYQPTACCYQLPARAKRFKSRSAVKRGINPPNKQRHHYLMVSRYLVALAAELGWTLDDVDARTVVALHIEIAGDKIRGLPAVK